MLSQGAEMQMRNLFMCGATAPGLSPNHSITITHSVMIQINYRGLRPMMVTIRNSDILKFARRVEFLPWEKWVTFEY